MTPDDRKSVREILWLDHAAMVRAIAKLTTAEQLHQLSLHYNVNDGFTPCVAIARHPQCDLGTAAWLYWQFHEVLVGAERAKQRAKKNDKWNADTVLCVLENRFAKRGGFLTAEYYFDPCEWLGLTDEDREAYTKAGLAPARLEAVGSRKVEREPLD